MVNLVVLGVGTSDTEPIEKAVLVANGLALLFAAYKVQTLPHRAHRS